MSRFVDASWAHQKSGVASVEARFERADRERMEWLDKQIARDREIEKLRPSSKSCPVCGSGISRAKFGCTTCKRKERRIAGFFQPPKKGRPPQE